MSKVTIEVTQEQAQALEALLALLPQPEAPATTPEATPKEATPKVEAEVEDCIATRKGDGQPCEGQALPNRKVCVAHSKVECKHGLTVDTCSACTEPKAKKPEPKPEPKATKAKGGKKGKKKGPKSELNGKLADAIRGFGGQPNGDTWKVAKHRLSQGADIEDAAHMAVITTK